MPMILVGTVTEVGLPVKTKKGEDMLPVFVAAGRDTWETLGYDAGYKAGQVLAISGRPLGGDRPRFWRVENLDRSKLDAFLGVVK